MILSRRDRELLLERTSITDKVVSMPAGTIDTARHGEPHFHVRPRTVVRAFLILVIIAGACTDLVGAYRVRTQHTSLIQRIAGIERNLSLRGPLIVEELGSALHATTEQCGPKSSASEP